MDKRRNRDRRRQGKKKEEYQEDIISEEMGVHQDFSSLMTAPVSEDDHFVFKSEKAYTVDFSRYSEFFTLDVKQLSMAIESVPFFENIKIEQKYFTTDQVTSMHNKAKKAKENYNELLETLHAERNKTSKSEDAESAENLGDDLDFLLNLKQPITRPPIIYKSSTTYGEKIESAAKNLELEKWLDSVLDD